MQKPSFPRTEAFFSRLALATHLTVNPTAMTEQILETAQPGGGCNVSRSVDRTKTSLAVDGDACPFTYSETLIPDKTPAAVSGRWSFFRKPNGPHFVREGRFVTFENSVQERTFNFWGTVQIDGVIHEIRSTARFENIPDTAGLLKPTYLRASVVIDSSGYSSVVRLKMKNVRSQNWAVDREPLSRAQIESFYLRTPQYPLKTNEIQ